ncbi:MAG: alpha/beta hydrolase fold domain-containing protein [Armatimonadota bacterium]
MRWWVRLSGVLALAAIVRLPSCVAQPQIGLDFEAGAWVLRDVQYREVEGYPLLLDAYLPADDRVHPALVFIHGGGWRTGSKEGGFRAVRGEQLIARGVAVFSFNYRLSGIAPYPAAVEDCLQAIRWIRANAADLNVDPDRLATWGGSAGAHLALMMGFLEPGEQDLDAQGNRLDNLVRCIVDLNGPTDLAADDMHSEQALVLFMGARRDEALERYETASPVRHLSADDPPVLIMHGTADRTVPYTQTVTLTRRMDELGVAYELFSFEGAGHGLQGADPQQREAAMSRAVEFVCEHLLGE